MQAVLLACVVYAGARLHQGIVQYEHYRVTKLIAFEPLALDNPKPVVVRASMHVSSRPAVESNSSVSALVVRPQRVVVPEQKRVVQEVSAPELKLENKKLVIPTATTSPVVAVGTFSHESPLTAPVAAPGPVLQAAGFGSVIGSGPQGRGGTVVGGGNGAFDAAGGLGKGNATGGRPVVATSGFGNGAIDTAALNHKPAIQSVSHESDAPVEITYKPRPDYTEEGRKQKINGEVRLEVLFKSDGRVQVVKVVQGLGFGLDEQAVKAAQQIKFKPALREGQPIDSMAQIHIIFQLIS